MKTYARKIEFEKARINKALSCYELAKKVDVSPSTIYRIRDGSLSVNPKIIKPILKELGVNFKDIFFYVE